MKLPIQLALSLVLVLAGCRTFGVEVSEAALEQSIGMTEAQLDELYGLPHAWSTDSDGVQQMEYGLEHWTFMSLDGVTRVQFTLVDGVVTRTKRTFSRRIAKKNRAR